LANQVRRSNTPGQSGEEITQLLANHARRLHSSRAVGQEQLIPNGGRFKPAFAERDKKQAVIDFRGISSNQFKTGYAPPLGFLGYELWANQVKRSSRSWLNRSVLHLVISPDRGQSHEGITQFPINLVGVHSTSQSVEGITQLLANQVRGNSCSLATHVRRSSS
jgi:hypothetical protein